MLSQSRRRNLHEVRSRRLILIEGDIPWLLKLAPVDLVIATHVLYFWHRPAEELALIRSGLRAGAFLALGYQLRPHMPRIAQRNFPKEGHVLYETDDEVSAIINQAGFKSPEFVVKGPTNAPEGRLVLAKA
jgi:hypothetical protein